MKSVDDFKARLTGTRDVAEILAAGWDIFALVALLAGEIAAEKAELFPVFMSVAAAAAEGRDAVGFAPSVPGGPRGVDASKEQSNWDVLMEAAELMPVLAAQLRAAAEAAGDRQACEHAARQAERVGELLSAVARW